MKSNKESLLIDMDGVLADTMGGVFDYVEERYGHRLAHEDIRKYSFGEELPREHIFEALCSPGFSRHLKLMTGAVRAVNRLREEYDGNVYICSAPMKGAEHSETEKRDWLAEHYDDVFAREAIITANKAAVPGRVLVEDNPDVTGGIWRPIMFDHLYNRGATQYPRMYGWHDLAPIRDTMRADTED